MGSRGSRSPSARGRDGGTGGLKAGDILSTTSLMSARERMQREVDEVMTTFRDVFDEYGAIVDDIQIATLKKKASGVLGYYDGANIAFNEKYLDSNKMNNAYKDSVEYGYHPSMGNKTALQAVASHELGHKLTSEVAVKMGKDAWLDLDSTATEIVKQARKSTNHRGVVQMASKISKYATSSNAEAIAEAFSDVYCNGNKAHSESKAIVNVVNSYLKK